MHNENPKEVSDGSKLPAHPTVSIIMPTYNHAPYLEEAVIGALDQETPFEVELLIGDDCSTDGTRELALRLQRRYPCVVRVLLSEENVGMHENHRRLVEASRGKYLAYCEGDDYWTCRDKLRRQAAILRGETDVGLVHSDFSHMVKFGGQWRARDRYWVHHRPTIPEGFIFEDLLEGNFVQTCTMMVRADIVRAFLSSPLPVDTYRVIDWPMCLFASATHKVRYISEPLATYRRVAGSATNLGVAADISRALDSIRMVTDFVQAFGAPGEVEAKAHAMAMRHILVTALTHGDRESASSAAEWLVEFAPGSLGGIITQALVRHLLHTPRRVRLFSEAWKRFDSLRIRSQYRVRPLAPSTHARLGHLRS